MRVVVLGGGVSGLVLARQLREEYARVLRAAGDSASGSVGLEVEVLEGASRAGGWLHTEHVHSKSGGPGYILERGARGVRPRGSGRRVLRLIESLGLREEALWTAKEGEARWVLHKGRPHQLPASAMGLVTGLPMVPSPVSTFGLEFTRAAHPDSAAKGGPGTPDESVHSFFSRRFGGPALADSLLDAMVAGVWAGDVRKLSAQSLFPLPTAWEDAAGSIQAGALASMAHSVGVPLPAGMRDRLDAAGGSQKAAALGAALEAQDIKEGPASSFVREASRAASVSFREGMGTLPRALVQDLGGEQGGWSEGKGQGARSRVRLGTRVSAVHEHAAPAASASSGGSHPLVVRCQSSSEGALDVPCDVIVSALPAGELSDVL